MESKKMELEVQKQKQEMIDKNFEQLSNKTKELFTIQEIYKKLPLRAI